MYAEWTLPFLVVNTRRALPTCGSISESHWTSGSLASKNGREGEIGGGVEYGGTGQGSPGCSELRCCLALFKGVKASLWYLGV